MRRSDMNVRAILAVMLVLTSAATATTGAEINVLSNRADLLSGGDALVEIVLPAGANASDLVVQLSAGGAHRDVSEMFTLRPNGKVQGLVTGLPIGTSTLIATQGGRREAIGRIELTNYPIDGPIFSGAQVQPWICNTEEAGLGPAQDSQCSAPTKVEYFYLSTDLATPDFLLYDPTSPPSDVRMTTTDQGRTVPFIVRREQGTLNRSIYSFAVLVDPSATTAPWQPPPAWNHKLYYLFGQGLLPKHKQGLPLDVLDDLALSRGFAVANTSRDRFGNNSNSVTSAESVMMLKEHIIETIGEIRYTLASGGSGGTMLQHQITNTYPGLLDGIQPWIGLKDVWTTNTETQDCSLLVRYFESTSPHLWPDITEQNAVMDNANSELPGTCRGIVNSYQLDTSSMNAMSASCTAEVDAIIGLGTQEPWMYNPDTNPTGTRCTLQDYQVAIFGRRPDGFANRPYDNVGVQYGLKALQDGTITLEQFVDLNAKVGGRDIDWNWTPQRSVADPFALTAVYRSGQINMGHGMATVPAVDQGPCRDNSNLHSCYHTASMRERLANANGHADNYVVLHGAPADVRFDLLNRWVAAIEADTSNDARAAKVVRHKPADAVDACWIDERKVTDPALCAAAFPQFGNPRIGAGAPLADDVVKCQLTPLTRRSYRVTFTDAAWARVQAVFPTGVCDWSKRSVGFEPAVPWLGFAGGPGGQPLGRPPESK